MWAKLEEVWRTHAVGRNQPQKQICQTNPYRYCGSSHPPQRCPAYGKRCGECAKMNHISAFCRSTRQAVHKLEEFGNNQINIVNTETSSFHNSINVLYKIDTDSNSNMLPFHIFKILFPKSANKLLSQTKNKNAKNAYKTGRQLGTCCLTLMHKEKDL